jgi:hypothetical protein
VSIFIFESFLYVYRSDSDDCDSDMDDSDSDEYERVSNIMQFMWCHQNNLFATALLATKYYMTYVDKNEAITLAQSRFGWTLEMLNTPGESHNMFRMNLFHKMYHLFVNKYGLVSSVHMNSLEAPAMFLVVCGYGTSFTAIRGIFKHSRETFSRKFDDVSLVWCPCVRTT